MARFKSTLEKQHVYKIAGFDVQFPMKPYGPQFTFMHKMLTTLELSRSSSSANALLESPTGTGKSLALLCAALAWQQHCKDHGCPPLPSNAADPGKSRDLQAALQNAGGFLPDLNATPDEEGAPGKLEKGKQAAKKDESKSGVPKIYYATRTHSQVGQVVRELSKTGYRTPMAILAARKHYCTHKTISKRKDINEECKNLSLEPNGCSYNRNMSKVKMHPSLQHGAVHEIHDIEDLVKIGKQVKGCSYFASRALAAEASIVFCPYNYIIDPVIRKAMDIDIRNSIIILDEAHNIEDVAREAAGTTVDLVAMDEVRLELQKMVQEEGQMETYQPLIDMAEGIIAWIDEKSRSLKKDGHERFHNEWFGDRLLSELEGAGIQPQSLNVLLSCFQKVSHQAGEAKPGELHVNGHALSTMEGLFTSLRFLLSNEARRLNDFCMVLQKFVKRGEGIRGTVWATELSLWCLNPAVAFEEVAAAARSIILTSGTLSPMDSFEKELGCKFSVTMEGSHVIDMEKQIWGGAVGIGPNDVVLNASYRNSDGGDFQDSLGQAIEECTQIVPDGLLIFFPSYKLMEKLSARWKSTGQWQRIAKKKPIYSETRGSDDQFDKVLAGYYSMIKKVQKRRAKTESPDEEPDPDKDITGAIFLAVCRGKVSEGIDFADGNARAVIVVGIPFPYAMDLQVVFKKQFNTVNQKSRDLQTGDQWYCQQAFRALNQAIGRCIRHRYDFGAVLLFDERFYRASNTQSLSKWLRSSITKFSNFRDSMDSLRSFFLRLELNPPKPASTPPPTAAAAEPPQGSVKIHPMFNKTLDPATGRPIPTQHARPDAPPPAPESENPKAAEALAERLAGFRAGPSNRAEASGQKAGYVRKYEATQPTRAEKRQLKRSPFWNEEGFVEPLQAGPSKDTDQKQGTQSQARRPIEQLDLESLESLDALVADCREMESLNGSEAGVSGGVRGQTGQPEVGTRSCAGPRSTQSFQPFSGGGDHMTSGPSPSGFAPHQAGVSQARQSYESYPGTLPSDPGTGAPETSLSCTRCGSEVASTSSSDDVTRTMLQKSFLQGLLEQSRSGKSPHTETRPGANGPGSSLYPIEVLVVNAGKLSGLPRGDALESGAIPGGRPGIVAGGVWVEKDGCVFEPVECSGCGPGGVVLGAKVLAADKANSFFNGQALLFSELLCQGPARQPSSYPNRGPPPRTSLPASPLGPPPPPSPSMYCTQPVRFSATPFDPSSKTQNPSSQWDQNPQASQRSSRDLPLPVGRSASSIPSANTAPGSQAATANVPPRETLYVPAADLLPPYQAPGVSAQAMVPPAYGDSLFENRVPPVNGSTEGKTARAPKPLYVASAGARRMSLQGGGPGKAAVVLSALEANVQNSGGAQGGVQGEAARELGARAPAPDAKARPQKARRGGGSKTGKGASATATGRQSAATPALAPILEEAGGGPTNRAPCEVGETPQQDVRKRAAGKKRKLGPSREDQRRPQEVIAETDSEDDAATTGRDTTLRKITKVHAE